MLKLSNASETSWRVKKIFGRVLSSKVDSYFRKLKRIFDVGTVFENKFIS